MVVELFAGKVVSGGKTTLEYAVGAVGWLERVGDADFVPITGIGPGLAVAQGGPDKRAGVSPAIRGIRDAAGPSACGERGRLLRVTSGHGSREKERSGQSFGCIRARSFSWWR